MLKKLLLTSLLATVGVSCSAANYFLVVPVKGKTESLSAIQVALSSGTLPGAQVGTAYSYNFSQNLQVTGDAAYTSTNVIWSVTQGAIPAGLVLNSATGLLSGVPTAGGTSTFTIQATYNTKNGAQSYQVEVVNIQVALGAGTPPTGMVGQAYSYDLRPLLTVQGDANYDSTKVQWSAKTSLPAGLSLSAGVVSGTPTTEIKPSVDITAAYKNIAATRTFTFNIQAPNNLALVSGHRSWADGTYATSCNEYRSPTDGHVYGGSTGDGTYRILPPGGSLADVYCDMTSDGGGWTLVRRVAASAGAWHPVTDNALGTAAAYGTYVANPQANSTFSLSYSAIPYTDLKFATGDAVKWAILAKTVFASSTGSCTIKVTVKASHISATPYSVTICQRYGGSKPEDPWVGVYDHGYGGTSATADNDTASMLYGEASVTYWPTWLSTRTGANVFIR